MTGLRNIQWFDNLRVIATIGVVWLHVSANILYQYGLVPSDIWWVGNVFDSIVRFSVPVFVMLSGALLLPQDIPLWVFYKKRLLRILFPFIFFSIIYLIFTWTNSQSSTEDIISWVFQMFKGGISFHFWFIYMLLGLYIIIPFLGKWVRQFTNKQFYWFFVFWFLLIAINIMALYLFGNGNFFTIQIFNRFAYVGYLVLGYFLSEKAVVSKNKNKIGLVAFITGVIITIFGTYFLTAFRGHFVGVFYENISPNVVLASAGLMLLVKNTKLKSKALILMRNNITKRSYGIYLIHILVLDYFSFQGIYWTMCYPLISIPVLIVLIFTTSFIIIYLLNKIPFIGKYVSG